MPRGPNSRSSSGPVTCTPFQVLPRRWVVERTLAWITRCRRTVRDYERQPPDRGQLTAAADEAGQLRRQIPGCPRPRCHHASAPGISRPGAGAGAAAERSRASSSQVLLAPQEDHVRIRSRLQRPDRARKSPWRCPGLPVPLPPICTPITPCPPSACGRARTAQPAPPVPGRPLQEQVPEPSRGVPARTVASGNHLRNHRPDFHRHLGASSAWFPQNKCMSRLCGLGICPELV